MAFPELDRDREKGQRMVKLFDVVAPTQDCPDHGLVKGQVGTIVEVLAPDVCDVEFSDNEGRTYAEVAIPKAQLMVLHHQPVVTR